jgi:hypothetical protein
MKIKFSISKCKTKAAYSAKLMEKGKLDLKKIKEQLEVILDTPILLVINSKAGEVIIHSHGELLFKKCKDVEQMEKTAEKIYSLGLDK